jgi:hypothetical protein
MNVHSVPKLVRLLVWGWAGFVLAEYLGRLF